jgi:hypothetical protein
MDVCLSLHFRSTEERFTNKNSLSYGCIPLIIGIDGKTLRQVSDAEIYQKSGGKRVIEPAKPRSSQSMIPPSSPSHPSSSRPTQCPSSRAPSHPLVDHSDRFIPAPPISLYAMPSIYENPRHQISFGPGDSEKERNYETWKREATDENNMRRVEGYCLASSVPPRGWDGRYESAAEYLSKTRTRPAGVTYAPIHPLQGYNYQSNHHSSSLPVYDGPPPDIWSLNNSVMRTERERSQGPRSAVSDGQGRYQHESIWEDVNMHHDRGAGPSNTYQSSRFVPHGDGTYAQLQRRL